MSRAVGRDPRRDPAIQQCGRDDVWQTLSLQRLVCWPPKAHVGNEITGKFITAVVAVLRRQMFLLRWIFVVSVSLTLVSGVQYALASRELEKTFLEHATQDFEAHADQLDKDLQSASTAQQRLLVLTAAIRDIATGEDGVRYVGVFDADGAEVGATNPGQETVSAGTFAMSSRASALVHEKNTTSTQVRGSASCSSCRCGARTACWSCRSNRTATSPT